jgi:ATP-dependent helicase HrpB
MIHRATDRGAAAELAVLLTERGLGGDSTDLALRLERFRADRSKRAGDARQLARRWGGPPGADADVGRNLARAFPDRVAQQAGARGRFRLANGRAATLDAADALAAAPFLVVTDVTGTASAGKIRAAASVSRQDIEAMFASRINSETVLHWDVAAAAVRARRRRNYAALTLADDPVPPPDADAAARVLAEHVAARLPWSKPQRALIDRTTFLYVTLGPPWPDLRIIEPAQLGPHLLGRTALADISAADLDGLLAEVLPYGLRAEIDRLLPSHFDAPSGNHVPIDYAAENGPALEIRVQELYGLNRHPSVANGKVPLLLVLLSPAHRPIQTTRDLPGFWRGSWADVARDMRGRYPRHLWPDDPANATATSRAKPRGT